MRVTIIMKERYSMQSKIYHTKQRGLLLSFFKDKSEFCFTSAEIIADGSLDIGTATVYRLLKKLTDEGLLKKYIAESGEGARYQYNAKNCGEDHFHLKCTECGELFHTGCKRIGELEEHLHVDHNFTVDNTKTVLYGLCKNCKRG